MSFGAPIDAYVESISTMLCANTIPVILEITKSKGQYHVGYCTHFDPDPYLPQFQRMFLNAQIPCSRTDAGLFEETPAVF